MDYFYLFRNLGLLNEITYVKHSMTIFNGFQKADAKNKLDIQEAYSRGRGVMDMVSVSHVDAAMKSV